VASGSGPYAHILVGTDGSQTAGRAVTHAAQLAHACGSRLTIISAFTRVETTAGTLAPIPDPPAGFLAAAAAHDNVRAGQDLARDLGVSDIGGRTEPGDPAAVLLDVADELAADLIVVGSRGMSTPSRFVLGSVPNRVSHHATCDVVIVHTTD